MKTIVIIIIALAAGLGSGYILFQGQDSSDAVSDSPKQLYTCGMHPEVISEDPGYCPLCGMKLTPRRDGGGGGSQGSLVIDPTTSQNMGVKTAAATYRTLSREIRAFGKIDIAEPMIQSVNLKVPGWVERLFVDYEGEETFEGQPLLDIYSPKLVAAQQEFLIASRSVQATGSGNVHMSELLEASIRRLENWDISADQIEHLRETGEIKRTMTVRSPATGIVVSKYVTAGDHLKPGATLYQIADISQVWAVGHVYEQDLPYVSLGSRATVVLPHLSQRQLEGFVAYVAPYLDARGQAEIRIDLDNADLSLKPEMYAEIRIESEASEGSLTIPRQAVINSGSREIVYVGFDDGSFEPRTIKTGGVGDGDLIEVVSGLQAGDLVVTSGQFLLDSESRLSEAIDLPRQHDHGSSSTGVAEMTESHSGQDQAELSGIYTCPMPSHFDVLQYGEGDCVKCGMALVPVEETENTEVYRCPMRECAHVRNTNDRCSVCGMPVKKLERTNAENGVSYD